MRINKIPFFLWISQRREDLTLNLRENFVESEELGKSSIKKVPIYLIVLMKYLPFVFFGFIFYYPTSQEEVLSYFSSLAVVIILVALYVFKKELLLKSCIIIICLLNFYFLLSIEDYAIFLDIGITFFVENIILCVLIFDIFIIKGYKNWYYLENFKNEINIKLSQKHNRRILFFFSPKRGVDVKKNVYIKGYFLRIENEDIF